MKPYEALYGRKCQVPLCWDFMDRTIPEGPDVIQKSIDALKIFQQNMKAAQSQKKIYVDNRRRMLQFGLATRFSLWFHL